METHKLAIVILNYNGINFLRKFMSNTVKHSEKFAIYVIDNNSSDDSLKYLNDEFPNIKIIVIQNGMRTQFFFDDLDKPSQFFLC